ncbi:SPOR domain-containing protein [Porphyromonas circumdentaria]|uniref:Sporulation related domain-containing protein n=1 Tax=Porphyromonas circumdentaria TaxID=29524 RepID=A0A1T4KF98_9PORP|nr:SPOR domain-containing protein [Porphyromonas circumdentaria]MBB6275072.1 cell division protein FtsN [Porphyromonas circumdentaria]MDO4722892.1 SPOR domain-containing protein [Porphyromonas circumdentaria]SJZ41090.1 Sporulation related domain-containing protein [Porphyromonas circumdentaria]
MKKSVFFILSLAVIALLGSCKPKQSTYRQVYEQAKQREIAQNQNSNQAPEATDANVIVSKPIQSSASLRRERLSAVAGEDSSRLKRYSVVIGSFQNKTNAQSLKERMENAGFQPVLAENEHGMIRVIVSSFSSREEAVSSRERIKQQFAPQFQDAWLLELSR